MTDTSFGVRFSTYRAPDTHLGFRFWQARRLFVSALTHALAQKGFGDLTDSLVNLMPLIDVQGTQITHLAARMSVSKQAAGKLSQRLVDLGYVRIEGCPKDRRAKNIVFTDRGLALLEVGEMLKIEIETRWLEGLTIDEQAQFNTLFDRIMTNAQAGL